MKAPRNGFARSGTIRLLVEFDKKRWDTHVRLYIGMRSADLDGVFFSRCLIAANYFLIQRNQFRLVLECIQQEDATTLWQP